MLYHLDAPKRTVNVSAGTTEINNAKLVARIADRTASQHHSGSRDIIAHVTI